MGSYDFEMAEMEAEDWNQEQGFLGEDDRDGWDDDQDYRDRDEDDEVWRNDWEPEDDDQGFPIEDQWLDSYYESEYEPSPYYGDYSEM